MRSTSRWIRPCTATTRSRSCGRGVLRTGLARCAWGQSSPTPSWAMMKGAQRLQGPGESRDHTLSRAQSLPFGLALEQSWRWSSRPSHQVRGASPQPHTQRGLRPGGQPGAGGGSAHLPLSAPVPGTREGVLCDPTCRGSSHQAPSCVFQGSEGVFPTRLGPCLLQGPAHTAQRVLKGHPRGLQQETARPTADSSQAVLAGTTQSTAARPSGHSQCLGLGVLSSPG